MINKALFTNNSDEWSTPQNLFDELNEEFNFTLDVCASQENTKCKKYFTIEDNALLQDWSNNICFMNPPYSSSSEFIKKAYDEAVNNKVTTIILIPSRTDTKYFHNWIYPFCGINSSDSIYAWCAGIIDGEGCIGINKRKPSKYNSLNHSCYYLYLKINMTDKKLFIKYLIFLTVEIFKK